MFSTAAPGAVHLLNGLYDAKTDGAPVLAITGMTLRELLSQLPRNEDRSLVTQAQQAMREWWAMLEERRQPQ